MLYFYAPSFVTDDPQMGPCFSPGAVAGDTIKAAVMPPGSTSPHYDSELPRFVLACPPGTVAQSGWESRTAEQVNADYPGTIGGA